MKILHYIPSIDESSGGVGAYMQLIARDLGKLCDLHVVTHHSEHERTIDNCTLHYLPDGIKNYFKTKDVFLQLLDEVKPDVFHSNCCWTPYNAFTISWAKDAGYKTILTPHGMLEPWILKRHFWTKKVPALLLYQKRAIKRADILHATADSEKKNLLKLGWNRNIKVIANCVQIDQIQMKESWNRKKSILFLSRVHVKKGINFLIEACSILKEELKGYTITIAGPGEDGYVKELKEMTKRLGVDAMVQFIGPVFGDDKWPLYRNADLFVLPTHSENFGIVVAEALASGTPVITTTGTPWEDLNTLKCGWWISIGTNPLVEALKSFLTCSSDELREMGICARKLVEDKYSSVAVAKEFVDMYNALTDELN